jgi:hypothetical protein
MSKSPADAAYFAEATKAKKAMAGKLKVGRGRVEELKRKRKTLRGL